jgi:hypothetical protein
MASARSQSRGAAAKSGLRPLLAMADGLDDGGLAELGRAIKLTLNPPTTPTEHRVAELGFLASLLNNIPPKHGLSFAVVQRKEYDQLRPATATSSAILVKRYGSWNSACYAAYGLEPDGRWTGPGRPWPSSRGYPAEKGYTREEVLGALRQCNRELGRRPTANVFARWGREKRQEARRRGMSARLPSVRVVYRYYPSSRGGWRTALRDAGLD